MGSSKSMLLMLCFLFAAVLLFSFEVSASDLAEDTKNVEPQGYYGGGYGHDHGGYGHGGYGHGGYGHGHGGYGHGGYGHGGHHQCHYPHCRGAEKEPEV